MKFLKDTSIAEISSIVYLIFPIVDYSLFYYLLFCFQCTSNAKFVFLL